jgi:hypothetical protein
MYPIMTTFDDLPSEVINHIFQYVISDRSQSCELVQLDQYPVLRCKLAYGKWGWLNKTRSHFYPYIAISRQIHDILMYDLKKILCDNRPKYIRPSLDDKSGHLEILPKSFYLGVLDTLEKLGTANSREYIEILAKNYEWPTTNYAVRVMRWTSIRAENSAQRAVIHRMASVYGYHHYTYQLVCHGKNDFHYKKQGWSYGSLCYGCKDCTKIRTRKCGVLITEEPVVAPKSWHNSIVKLLTT